MYMAPALRGLIHWGRVTHICVGQLIIIGSDNGLSPGRHQTNFWTNAGILLIRPVGTNFCEILIGIQTFSFKKIHLEMSSAKWRPFCLRLNVIRKYQVILCSNSLYSSSSNICRCGVVCQIVLWCKYSIFFYGLLKESIQRLWKKGSW